MMTVILVLCAGVVYLDARMTPNYRELEATGAYQRGMYFRTMGDESSEVWQEKADVGPQARWRTVEWGATGSESGAVEEMPTVPAVRFLGVVNGKHHWKPDSEPRQATKEDSRETIVRCMNSEGNV